MWRFSNSTGLIIDDLRVLSSIASRRCWAVEGPGTRAARHFTSCDFPTREHRCGRRFVRPGESAVDVERVSLKCAGWLPQDRSFESGVGRWSRDRA